jgi:hypothetical protein
MPGRYRIIAAQLPKTNARPNGDGPLTLDEIRKLADFTDMGNSNVATYFPAYGFWEYMNHDFIAGIEPGRCPKVYHCVTLPNEESWRTFYGVTKVGPEPRR